jgi:hypothetical protein
LIAATALKRGLISSAREREGGRERGGQAGKREGQARGRKRISLIKLIVLDVGGHEALYGVSIARGFGED